MCVYMGYKFIGRDKSADQSKRLDCSIEVNIIL
jgi:hypothetical protein